MRRSSLSSVLLLTIVRNIAGFVTLWALNYVTVLAEGFALETALAILGVSWLPFFLIMWIISALSPCPNTSMLTLS